MNKLIMYLSVFVLLVSSVFAVEKMDYVQLVENTDYCFDCHTIYKITKADDNPLTKLNLDFKDAKGLDIAPDYEISYLKTEDYTELVDVYTSCTLTKSIISNDTGEEKLVEYESECLDKTEKVTKQRSYYAPVSSLNDIKSLYDSASVSDSYYIMISGHLNLGEAIDNILVLNDYTYDEYAWWNASFASRLNITNRTASDLAVVINATAGFGSNIIWYNPSQMSGIHAIYYNDTTSYYTVANDSQEAFYEVEGKSKNRNYSSVYGNKAMGIYHMNSTADSSSRGNNLSNVGADPVTGYLGGAYDLENDSHDYLYDSTFSDSISSSFTITMLLKPESWGPNYYPFDLRNSSNGDANFIRFYIDSSGKMNFYSWVGSACSSTLQSTSTLSNGQWHFIAATYNGSLYKLYYNGTNESQASGSCTYTSNLNQLYLTYSTGTSNWYDGLIDEVRIYNRTMNSSEILEFYNNLKGSNNILGTGENYSTWYTPIVNESEGRNAIIAGVMSSEIASSYVAYDDKQVYIRLMNSSQYKGSFDKFITVDDEGSYKRWAFNYDQNTSSSFPTFKNMTPAFYVWQKYNLTYEQIRTDVSSFINNTYP